MATKWAITTATDHVALDGNARGETTFTLTNPGTRPDRVVFEVVPGDGADRSWFAVDEPQRLVPAGGSVSYLVRVALPAGTPPGAYSVQGRVYSAESAPEEASVLSGLLTINAKPTPVPVPRRRPWWLLVVAGLVAVVLSVVGWLVFDTGTAPAARQASQPSASPVLVTVPDLTTLSQSQAVETLSGLGLVVGRIQHKQQPATPDKVLTQSVPARSPAATGTKVDLVVAVSLTEPIVMSPSNRATLPSLDGVTVQWRSTEPYVSRWRVLVTPEVCAIFGTGSASRGGCMYLNPTIAFVDTPSFTPHLALTTTRTGPSFYNDGSIQWSVNAIDDFGNVGPGSSASVFQVP